MDAGGLSLCLALMGGGFNRQLNGGEQRPNKHVYINTVRGAKQIWTTE